MTPRDSERTKVTNLVEIEGAKPARPMGTACVVVIYGPDLGKRLPLGTAPFEIGRSAKNDLPIDQESVSRHHARITFDGQGYRLHDLQSTNGTFINDEAIVEERLADGDQVRVGRSILKFMTGENIEVQYHEEIYRLMTVDGLTQVYNRRFFNEALEREFNRSKRYQRALSLILFDIDFFKRINDTFGHVAGDNVLRHMALSIRPRLRREDIFARTGGEEFGVLLPEIAVEGARTIAEKIRRIVETAQVKHEQQNVRWTISLGVAGLNGDEASPEDLYRAADQRLYEAKQGGRNRVAG
ncbi:MAG TPA: GGDEF domain-containing protein [Polyangiaceae bacterium]|nr:GGDEF domain-containing protein [Polyangiaceae bacterium]